MMSRFAAALGLALVLTLPTFAQPFLPPEESFRQWSQWEKEANTARFRKTGDVEARVVMVPSSEVIIDADPNLDERIRRHFIRGDQVMFPLHPHNTSNEVPFQDRAEVERWVISPTASRSVVHWDPYFTIKMPTDHPHGPNGQRQSGKVQLYKSVIVSRARSEHIREIDARIGGQEKMGIMHDVLTIRAKTGGNGFVVRDLSEMRAGHYYVPGFSIPYIGQQIAEANGMGFEEFWRKHDAEVYGRIKAQMLLRYGLWFETPNAQNRLIELDRNLKPTGRILIRDLSDSLMHKQISKAIGAEARLNNDIREGVMNTRPYGSNSYWQMDEAPNVRSSTVNNWIEAHEASFAKELSRVLGYEIRVGQFDRPIPEEGLQKLKEWHEAQARGGEGFSTRRNRGINQILEGRAETGVEIANRRAIQNNPYSMPNNPQRTLLTWEMVREGAVARLNERILEAQDAETRRSLEAERERLVNTKARVVESVDIFAERRGAEVVVSTGLLEELEMRSRLHRQPLLPERLLALVLGHEAAHASGIRAERIADAEGIRALERSPLGLPSDAEIRETLRAFERPTGSSHLDNFLNRLRNMARYGTARGRLDAMRRAAAGEADRFADYRRADGTLKWTPLIASGLVNEVKAGGHFALALFLKELAAVYMTGDRARIEEFFEALKTLDFYKHYGAFVVGARMTDLAYTRYLERYVKPGFVNTVLRTNVVLAAGIALPMIMEGTFTLRTWSVSVGALGLSSLAIQGGMSRLAFVMKLDEARRTGLIARVASSPVGKVGGWVYTAAQLAVILYVAEKIERPINEYFDLRAERQKLAQAGVKFVRALGESTTPIEVELATREHHAAWIEFRNYLFAPLDNDDALYMQRMQRLARDAKLNEDARRRTVQQMAKSPTLRQSIIDRGFADMSAYTDHLLEEDTAELTRRAGNYMHSYNMSREQNIREIYESNRRSNGFLHDVDHVSWALRGWPQGGLGDPAGDGTGFMANWTRNRARVSSLNGIHNAYESVSENRTQAYEDQVAILAAAAQAMLEVDREAEAMLLNEQRRAVEALKDADRRLVLGDGVVQPGE